MFSSTFETHPVSPSKKKNQHLMLTKEEETVNRNISQGKTNF